LRRAVALTIAVAALVAVLVVGLGPILPTPLKKGVNWLRGHPRWLQRAALGPEAPSFAGLAASQVGYGPSMVKQFSSPKRFASFRVVSTGGQVAFRGGPPVREVRTEALGAVRSVWIGDFTPLRFPESYRIVAENGIVSYPFDVGPSVFDTAARAVQRAFYYQRAFTEIDAEHAKGPWIRASDAAFAPRGVVKGWHDAGDFSLYRASTNSALFWLLSVAADFSPQEDDTGIPESGNGVPNLLDEARWGLDWLLSVQEASGGFHNTTCQERYGPYGTNWPERLAPYHLGEVGTIAAGRTVGTLAFASVLYRSHDTAFAERLLQAARTGYRFHREHLGENSDGPTCPAMRQDGDTNAGRDVRTYAAAGLLLATGNCSFRADFEESYQPLHNDPSCVRSNVDATLLYLRASAGDPERKRAIRREFRLSADEVRRDGEGHTFQWAGRTFWGSIAAGFQRTAGFSAQACPEDPVEAVADCEQVLANVHHALGRNYQQIAYVSGLPGVSRGRTRAFHHWLAALDVRPFVFPGLVAGRPITAPEPADVSVPHARPLSDLGLLERPRHATRRLDPTRGALYRQRQLVDHELDIDWQGVTLYNLYRAVVGRCRPDEACRFAIRTGLPVAGALMKSLFSYRSSSPRCWCGLRV
jgi:endoglucanase